MRSTKLGACLALCLLLLLGARDALADAEHEGTFWPGYMSTWWVDPNWSLWFDSHYNLDTFFMARGGLTHVFDAGPSVTGGYAFLLLNPSFERHEHRPWAQVFAPWRINDLWSLSGRLRMDFRLLQSVEDGEIEDDWDFVFRPRVQGTLTRNFEAIRFGEPFAQLSYELLLNAASDPHREVVDQSRVSLLFGLRMEHVTVRVGYMNRYLPHSRGDGLVEHAALLWFTQSFDFVKRRRLARRAEKPEYPDYDDYPEYGGE